ncbi:MAG: hypothetical protein PVI30_08505 [Myxococcales bacterium]
MLDGKLLLDPGRYQLEVTADGYEITREKVVARPREKMKLTIELSPIPDESAAGADNDGFDPTTQQWVGIGVAGAGVISLGIGTYFGLTAMSKADDADCNGGVCADEAAGRLNNEAVDAGNLSTVFFAAGAGAAAIGAVLYFVPLFGEEEERPQTVRIAPVLSPQQAGIQLGGRW